ncbi:hypothetical protein [Rhodanobacter sp. OK091]|uniref:hypothetical protein n=1 Tax=Rhodanobacter sp. OK091 TaxID=1881037 RepID=UPI0009352506|nr:hypothetical protein [Rhodanobacter sp. OK091]
MNWQKIIWLALSLFVAQFTIGFLEGLLSSPRSGVSAFLIGKAASLVVCSVLFGCFAARNPIRTLAHAWLALLFQVLAATLFSATLSHWLDEAPRVFVVAEWAVLVAALGIGTWFGSIFVSRMAELADA